MHIKIKNMSISFEDNHDISAIIEVLVLDVYKMENIKNGDTVLDLGAGIG
ncbi:hypothetical protein OXIME_000762 [Oxyplasma meridianum]|uniref:SAM-dependent methyltransferase n=1 Tax=Oxyplasma meridianum TaxID=3073602 RepID=A0AAX4NGU1_9ARCH